MLEWITPIYDRTQQDVDFAKTKIAEWKSGKSNDVYDLKGCLNVSDINRIENNIKYLSNKLNELGYSNNTYTKVWSRTGLPNQQDIDRIINNVKELITAFCQQQSAPNIPDRLVDYNDINAIEKNLSLIKELIDYMVNSYKVSGALQSGQTIYLPIRR